MRLKDAASRQPVKTRTMVMLSGFAPSFAKAAEGGAMKIMEATEIQSGRIVTGRKVLLGALQVNLFVLVNADGGRFPALHRGIDEEGARAEHQRDDGTVI